MFVATYLEVPRLKILFILLDVSLGFVLASLRSGKAADNVGGRFWNSNLIC